MSVIAAPNQTATYIAVLHGRVLGTKTFDTSVFPYPVQVAMNFFEKELAEGASLYVKVGPRRPDQDG